MQEYRFQGSTLGTVLVIRIVHSSSPEEEFLRIMQACREFDGKYSRFQSGNMLQTINEHHGGAIDTDFENMLSFSLELARLSDGYFDPTVGPILEAYGYGNANTTPIENISHGYENIQLAPGKVVLKNGVRIELGGVGKGYLLEKIAHMLGGFERFLIDFWGDIFARWAWDVALEHPLDASLAIGKLHLQDGYFCASSGLRRRLGAFHHLIDPRTKESASEVIGSFVESSSGMVADGYATLLCVCPLEKSLEILTSWNVEGAIVSAGGHVYLSGKSAIELFS